MAIKYYISCILCVAAIALHFNIGLSDTSEHGLLELTQLVLLAVSLALWGTCARIIQRSSSLSTKHSQAMMLPCFAWFGTLLMFTFIGREISWLRIWGWHQPYGISVKAIWVSLILALLSCVIVQWWRLGAQRFRAIVHYMQSYTFRYYVIASCWILLGDAFEKNVFGVITHAQYYEELCETFGYFTCLCAAPLVWKKEAIRLLKRYQHA